MALAAVYPLNVVALSAIALTISIVGLCRAIHHQVYFGILGFYLLAAGNALFLAGIALTWAFLHLVATSF